MKQNFPPSLFAYLYIITLLIVDYRKIQLSSGKKEPSAILCTNIGMTQNRKHRTTSIVHQVTIAHHCWYGGWWFTQCCCWAVWSDRVEGSWKNAHGSMNVQYILHSFPCVLWVWRKLEQVFVSGVGRKGSLASKVCTYWYSSIGQRFNSKDYTGNFILKLISTQDNANCNLLDPFNIAREFQSESTMPCWNSEFEERADFFLVVVKDSEVVKPHVGHSAQ